MLQAPGLVIIPVSVPCYLEVVPRGYQKPQERTIWDKGIVDIEDVTAREVVPAFRVTEAGERGRRYEILRYRGKFWWPLFETGLPMTSEVFEKTAEDSTGCFLASLNYSPATLAAPRDSDGFDIDFFVGRIIADSRDDRWKAVRRTASRFLSFKDRIYAEGGSPVYFASMIGPNADSAFELSVGQLRPGANFPGDRWHPGLSANKRERAVAANQTSVVRPTDADVLGLDAEAQTTGKRVLLEALVDDCGISDVVHYSADALSRIIIRRAPTASAVHDVVRPFTGLLRRSSVMPITYAREILWLAVHVARTPDFERLVGMTAERVNRLIHQIDEQFPVSQLTPEQEDLLRLL